MKIYCWSHGKKRVLIAAAAAVTLLAAAIFFIYVFPKDSVKASGERADRYEIKSGLFMQAVKELGVSEPQEAARLWAEGVNKRNGAMQYAVMTDALKEAYARSLDEHFPNWVTGLSSPWIASYAIEESADSNEKTRRFSVVFSTATSSGPAGTFKALLTIAKEKGFWRIQSIKAGPELLPYTGFKQQ